MVGEPGCRLVRQMHVILGAQHALGMMLRSGPDRQVPPAFSRFRRHVWRCSKVVLCETRMRVWQPQGVGPAMKGTIIIGFAIALAGLLALGIFGASKSPAKEAEANLAFYDWDETLRSKSGWASPNHWANSVVFVRVAWWPNSSRARTFEYLTGGRAGIADPDALASARLARVPDRLLANHQEDKVLVRFWSNDHTAEQAEELALRTARTMHLATTQVWPREPLPVQVDVYSMPEGAAYSFAKKVRWKRGRPLELAIFLPGAANAENRTQVAAHELYHLLAAFRRIGRWKTDETVYLNTQIGFEEVAAT